MNHAETNKAMFDDIAPHYDFLNHFLSLNIDKIWRKKVVKEIVSSNPDTILDIATGTADLAILMAKKSDKATVTGIDAAENMLNIGQEKVAKANLTERISLMQGDALNLPFANNSFDTVTCAFGIRNFADRQKGLDEMQRVLRNGGQVAILEFSMPQKAPFKQLYRLYFKHILPAIGKLFSKNKSAYRYLPESVEHFPSPDGFIKMMLDSGFEKTSKRSFSLGIAYLYIGYKI